MNSSRKISKSSAQNGLQGAGGKTPSSKVPLKGGGNGSSFSSASSLSQSRAKTHSQEDLTKPKDRASSRSKFSGGASSSSSSYYGASRRLLTGKDTPRSSADRTSRDKIRSTVSCVNKPNTVSTSSATSRSRTDSERSDRATLEAKIKDLMTMAKGKDTEIKSLKQKLDTMSHLLENQNTDADSSDSTTQSPMQSSRILESSTPISNTNAPSQFPEEAKLELQNLKDENLKLKEQLDAMMLSMRQKTDTEKSLILLQRHNVKLMQNPDIDASSHDGDPLSSSLEDLASASNHSHASRGTSRSASAENLLDDVGSGCENCSSRNEEKILSSSEGCGSENSSAAAVVCLTEKIHRMQESQISTNEELEATVQELTDLQKSLPELATENNRLKQEKHYLMQKLCDTEKRLEQRESDAQHLRILLNDRMREDPEKTSVEQQYMQLLDEREHLLDIQEDSNSRVRKLEQQLKDSRELASTLEEQKRKIEREFVSLTTERNRLEKTLQELKDFNLERKHLAAIQHLEEALAQERERSAELLKSQAVRAVGDSHTSEELVALLDKQRKEKHDVEEKYLAAEEELAQAKEENEKLDDKVAELEEELEAAGAKTKKDLSELSEVIDHLQEDIRVRILEMEDAKETIFIMEDAVEQHMAVKKHDNHMISKLQGQISTLKEEKFRLGKEIHQLKKEQKTQSEEWKQFQADLQMAVMIANDMKAETQSEVARLREENQLLDERITKLQVENEQLRRRRKTTSSIGLTETELRPGQRSVEKELAALRESMGVSRRRYGEQHSPGVQSLIKSFDNQIMLAAEQQQQKTSPPSTPMSPTIPEMPLKKTMSENSFASSSKFSPSKALSGLPNQKGSVAMAPATNGTPIMAEVSPIQRHHSMSSLHQQTSIDQQSPLAKITAVQQGSHPGTPDGKRNSSADLSQLSSLLLSREKRSSSTSDSRKQSLELRKPLTGILLDRLSSSNPPSPTPSASGSTTGGHDSPIIPAVSATAEGSVRRRALSSTSDDPLATLARRYGGSKRNALLKWCQEKTKGYAGIDITNFSSSWTDGLAFCALVHANLPAHIPYDNLQQQLAAAVDQKTRNMLQAKNFRLAFAAAESVGIEPTLTVDEMTSNDRPEWQRVMRYVTEIYKYFEM